MSDRQDGVQEVRDSRRAPFCYQTHDALDTIRGVFEGQKLSTAIAIYVSFTEAANRNGGAAARDGFEAGRQQIAERAGVSVDTLDRYAAEFVKLGLLDVERRKIGAVNLPNRWVLTEPSAPPGRTGAATPGRTGAAPRARSSSEPKKQPEEKSLDVSGPGAELVEGNASPFDADPPPLVRVDGRDLGMDALAEVCGLLQSDPSYGQVVRYLRGWVPKGAGATPEAGIAELCWNEYRDYYRKLNQPGSIEDMRSRPEEWQMLLGSEIHRRAGIYRDRMGDALLTPKSLRDWWHRLLAMEKAAPTADDIRNLEI